MNKFLFLFSIGHVQLFIKNARKLHDLYTGSRLLSDLMDFAIKSLPDNNHLLFPIEKLKSKPNRLLAVITSEHIQKTGDLIEKKVREKILKIFTFYTEDYTFTDDVYQSLYNFLDIRWVAVPLKTDEEYHLQYKQIMKMMRSVKNTGAFLQLSEPGGRKCSLCGEHNVMFYRKTEKGKTPSGILNAAFPVLHNHNHLFNPGEAVCNVCMLKRLAYSNENFPSTSKIALMNWLENIPNDQQEKYKNLFNERFDEALYFEENLREEYLKRFDHWKNKAALIEAQKQLSKFQKEYQEKQDKKPFKYYAVILADGDNMGTWLSGEFLSHKSRLREFQKYLASELGKYADSMVTGIPESKGKVVYAGGDDLLVFVNLKYLFEILKKIHQEYPDFRQFGETVKTDNRSTLSCGIVIAHYKTPLSRVLNWVRKMENKAKTIGKRDAFGLAILKRSGEVTNWVNHWKDERNKYYFDQLTNLLYNLKNELSPGFMKTFYEEFSKIDDNSLSEMMLMTELTRLTERSIQMNDQNKREKAKHMTEDWLKSIGSNKKDLFEFFRVVDFLYRRVR